MSGLIGIGDGLTPFGLAADVTEAAEAVEVLRGRNRCEGPAAEGDRGFTLIGALAATLVAEAAESVLCRGGICISDSADSKLVAAEETGREAIEARGVVSPALGAATPRVTDSFGLAVLVLVAVVREVAVEGVVEEGVGGTPPFRRVIGVVAFERTEGAMDLGLPEAGVSGAFIALVPTPRRDAPVRSTGETDGVEDVVDASRAAERSLVPPVSDRLREGAIGVPIGEGIGEERFLLGEVDPLAGRGGAGISRVGADRRGADVDAVVVVVGLVESAFDFERFRCSTLARIEVMLATSISGSSRSLDISAANPARVLGPRTASGGVMRSFSFSISRSGSIVSDQIAQKTIRTHPERFPGAPIARDDQSRRPVEPAPSACAANAEYRLVWLPRVVEQ